MKFLSKDGDYSMIVGRYGLTFTPAMFKAFRTKDFWTLTLATMEDLPWLNWREDTRVWYWGALTLIVRSKHDS